MLNVLACNCGALGVGCPIVGFGQHIPDLINQQRELARVICEAGGVFQQERDAVAVDGFQVVTCDNGRDQPGMEGLALGRAVDLILEVGQYGINFFNQEAVPKRLGLLRELVPKAVRIAVLVNPTNVSATEGALPEIREAARALGLQLAVLNASTNREIEAAFSTLVPDRADALFVAPDGFFTGRAVQFATLAAHHRVPAAYTQRHFVEAGGLMSYGTDIPDMFRQVGIYTGQILKGVKPADLPVAQSTKFELVINLQTARALGLDVPNAIQLLADQLIE